MAQTFGQRLQHAWNALTNDEKPSVDHWNYGPSYSMRPDRPSPNYSNERNTVASLYNQLSIDVAGVDIRHVRTDQNGRFVEEVNSGLNYCLTWQANLDQAARHFRQDIALSLFQHGVVAIVPVDTDLDPNITGGYNILSLRVGEIKEWYPQHVRVNLYDERDGQRKDIILHKKTVAIVENPLYSIMNEPNSTLKRLIRKINMLDGVDEQTTSGKLDLLIQLPYVVKTETRQKQADQRRQAIEDQLSGSKYGIAYIDGTERVTQLNRPAENNLLLQINELKAELYNQLGMPAEIFKGTADQQTTLNYYTRAIDPIASAIVEAMRMAFLTKTAKTQGQNIMYFRDPFRLVPVSDIAEIADKFTRNEILSSNEIRGILGMRPSSDPAADQLRNKNLNPASSGEVTEPPMPQEGVNPDEAGL